MGQGTLTIYGASAGSGKTFKLAGIYLSLLFSSRYNYRKILAVTFTNKATAEMKSRILDQLHCISSGDKSEYLPDLIKKTGKTEDVLRKEAGEILFAILHDFSRFSVCTIDAFFQKVIRAFARELNLHSGFSIELDHSVILSDAVDGMLADSAQEQELGKWLNEYVMSNLDDEKSWNLKGEIMKLSEELFKEKFKILSADEQLKLGDKEFLLKYISNLRTLTASFRNKLTELGKKCEKISSDHGLTDDMFFQKSKGVPGFIRNLALGKMAEPKSYVREILKDPPKWSTGLPCQQLRDAISGGLDEAVKEAIRFWDNNIVLYNSANAILPNIYALGILSDVLMKIRNITASENSFLITDAGELLSLITRDDQAPFIYEKIGNRYENYMIDEFQDTSQMQWNNFSPLISESMGGGHDNLVVGDVKQSIYRFRNSDWQILGRMQNELVDNVRFLSEPLKTNFRSRTDIIRFNNSLFSIIPEQIDALFSENTLPLKFTRLYAEAVQKDPGRKGGGYVRLEFIDDEKHEEEQDINDQFTGIVSGPEKKWRDIVLEKLPAVIETFQDKGYKASDIGILVREGREGADVLNRMISYSNGCSPDRKRKYNYNIVSNDSLALSNSPAINFIISVLIVLNDPSDMISRARMLRFFLMAKGNENAQDVPLFSETLIEDKNGYFPDGYKEFLKKASQMPLFEAVENIISFFSLGSYAWNVSYFNTFQDLVLNFTGSKNTDLQSFLEWWETTGKSKSVILPANKDAAKVITIHKSKGLEFKIVIIPFISWNIDHKIQHHPILWIKPETPPFNTLGVVPVRYQTGLEKTIFADAYFQEKYSAYLDNINLLYVAMTRAVDAIWGFLPATTGKNNEIARTIKDAICAEERPAGEAGIFLAGCYDKEKNVFELGTIPGQKIRISEDKKIPSLSYLVGRKPESLKLKLHGENYFLEDREAVRKKINYGKLMHEVFEDINTREDIPAAVKRLVLEGKVEESESASLISRLDSLVSVKPVSDWFRPGNNVLKESEILLPSGVTRRPDRVIINDGKAVIIDFKFGEENKHYTDQVRLYRRLLSEMGYKDIEAFLWYVDKNKIVTA